MEKSRVVIVRCENYEEEAVFQAVKQGIQLLGGLSRFLQKDEKILLKPNLLAKAAPERAVTTHPMVFSAVCRLLRQEGYEDLRYGDSSGVHLPGLTKIAESCGFGPAVAQWNIEEGDFSGGQPVKFQRGRTAKEFVLCNGILEADAIVNLCKMKTHQLERITGAVKNIFGAVYGFNKGAFHAAYPDAESFGDMLADLNLLVKPRLHIMDGIVAMEGNGPQSGNPVAMKILLFSEDPVALDAVFCHLVDLPPEQVPTNVSGQRAGVGTMREAEIEIITEVGVVGVAEAARLYGNPEFDVPRDPEYKGALRPLRWLMPLLQRKPVLIKEKCIGCGLCVESCPLSPKAVALEGEKRRPRYDYKRCIRCYCCQEMCPKQALDVKTPWIVKLLDRNWKL